MAQPETPPASPSEPSPQAMTGVPPDLETPADGAQTPSATDGAALSSTPASPAVPEGGEKKPDALARGFGALARREKEIRTRESAIKEQESSLKRFGELQELAKSNPLAALKALNLTYDQVTDQVLADFKPAPTEADKLQQLQDRIDAREKAEKEAATAAASAQVEHVINTQRRLITETAKGAPEKYELVNAEEAHELAWQVTEEHWRQHQKLLSPAEALDAVEAHLEEQTRKRLALKKFAAATGAKADSSDSLTQRNGAGAPVIVSTDKLPLDPDERTAAISRQFKFWSETAS